jgi:hypothetical protein
MSMTTSSEGRPAVNYRKVGTRWADKAQQWAIEAEEVDQEGDLVGLAQAAALMAIYCELRHGNNLAAMQAKAADKQWRATGDMIDELRALRVRLRER